MTKKNRQIVEILDNTYPDAKCALDFKTPYQLLIATVMSAQTTDKQVNKVNEKLFKLAPTPKTMLELGEEGVREQIKSIGFFNNKAKNIISLTIKLLEDFGEEVPGTMEELTSLDGVGRKTANVVLSNCFGVPSIAVDTHVFRVSNRLGLAKGKNPEEVEMKLQKNLDKNLWSKSHNLLIAHGRALCSARSPKCEICPLNSLCPDYKARLKMAKNKQ